MLEIVVEDNDVAGLGLQDQSRYVMPLQAPDLAALPNLRLQGIGIGVTDAMAARNYAQRAAVRVSGSR